MSELNPADQIFYILLIGGLILVCVGCILYFVMDILERKQEIKDFNLSQSFNKAQGVYEYHPNCYCKRCQTHRQNKRRTLNIHLN